jgi:putative transposase
LLPRSSPYPGTPILPKTADDSTAAVSSPDNGPCFKSRRFAAFIDSHSELIHIRTRRKSPGQNGVRERAFGSLKYEHLSRHEIDDGHDLGLHVDRYRQLFNTVRPHHSLAGRRPHDVHLEACKTPQITKSNEPETLPLS